MSPTFPGKSVCHPGTSSICTSSRTTKTLITLGVTFAYTAFRACLSLWKGVLLWLKFVDGGSSGKVRWHSGCAASVCSSSRPACTSWVRVVGQRCEANENFLKQFQCNPGCSYIYNSPTQDKGMKKTVTQLFMVPVQLHFLWALSVLLQGLGFSWKERV